MLWEGHQAETAKDVAVDSRQVGVFAIWVRRANGWFISTNYGVTFLWLEFHDPINTASIQSGLVAGLWEIDGCYPVFSMQCLNHKRIRLIFHVMTSVFIASAF